MTNTREEVEKTAKWAAHEIIKAVEEGAATPKSFKERLVSDMLHIAEVARQEVINEIWQKIDEEGRPNVYGVEINRLLEILKGDNRSQ